MRGVGRTAQLRSRLKRTIDAGIHDLRAGETGAKHQVHGTGDRYEGPIAHEHVLEETIDAGGRDLSTGVHGLGAVDKLVRRDTQLRPRVDDERAEFSANLALFLIGEIDLGAVGLRQEQLVAHEILDQRRDDRVRRVLDLWNQALLRRIGVDPAHELPSGEVTLFGRADHHAAGAIVVQVGDDVARHLRCIGLDGDGVRRLEACPVRGLGGRSPALLHQFSDLTDHGGVDRAIQDVETEACLDDLRDLARLERLQRRLELGHHHALLKGAEGAALCGRSRILAELRRQGGEVRRRQHLA